MDAHEIKQIVARYFTDKLHAVHFEVGLNSGGKLRADVLCITMRSQITIVEVKSSVADFRSDKKWQLYLEYCDRYMFAVTDLTYAKIKHLLPKGVGVFVINSVTKQLRLRGRTATRIVNPTIRLNIMTRMGYRSANVTRYKKTTKSKVSGAQLIARVSVQALREARAKGQLNKHTAEGIIVAAINKYV